MTDQTHDHGHHKDNSLDRLLFFSDGVFAIAITLLSIELHVPHDWDGTFGSLMRDGWPMFGAFLISFAVIGILWNAHRRAFVRMMRFTTGVFVLNLGVLAGIALMPFTTQLLYANGPRGEAVAIYLALVSSIGLMQGLGYGYAAFIADAVRPKQHWMMRLSAVLMQSLMPGLCSGLTLLFMAFLLHQVGFWIILVLAVALALLIAFRRFASRRYGSVIVA